MSDGFIIMQIGNKALDKAYKDISEVVETVDVLGISKKVVKLKPIGNIKG